jgi:hypothetical protein
VDRLLHHLVHHPVLNLVNDKDLVLLVRHLCAVDSFHFHLFLQVAMFRDELQNLGEQNLDEHLSYRHEVHLLILLDVVVDVEVRHH